MTPQADALAAALSEHFHEGDEIMRVRSAHLSAWVLPSCAEAILAALEAAGWTLTRPAASGLREALERLVREHWDRQHSSWDQPCIREAMAQARAALAAAPAAGPPVISENRVRVAAPAAPASPPAGTVAALPLDVERLRDALRQVVAERGYIDLGTMDLIFGGISAFDDIAAAIAAEYARLAGAAEEEEA